MFTPRTAVLGITIASLLLPSTTFALGKRSYGRTRILAPQSSTQGIYQGRGMSLPGTWETVSTDTSLTFTRKSDGAIVNLEQIPKDECLYGFVRINALKKWGGMVLDQSSARIENVSYGTSKFKGYTWVVPSTGNTKVRHWCIGQDAKSAVEVTAPETDKELITFMKNDFMMQVAVRRGRSVTPYPLASGSGGALR